MNDGFAQALALPPTPTLYDSTYNALQNMRVRWSGDFTPRKGTAGWTSKSAEWLLVNIVAELLSTPRNRSHGSGWKIEDIQSVYIPIVRDLVGLHSIGEWTFLTKYRKDVVIRFPRDMTLST